MNFRLLIICFWVVLACKNETNSGFNNNAKEDDIPEFIILSKTIEKHDGDCENPETPCFNINIEYPIIEGNDSLKQNFELFLVDFFDDFMATEITVEPNNIEDYLNMLITNKHAEFITTPERDGYTPKFDLDVTSKSIFNNDALTCFETNYYIYEGGAHGNHAVSYHIYENASGQLLDAEDIIEDEVTLKAMAIANIKQNTELEAKQDLSEAGFFVNDNEFEINDNIGLTDDSLSIVYVPYEIGPYSMGYTNVEFAKAEITSLLKADFVEKWNGN